MNNRLPRAIAVLAAPFRALPVGVAGAQAAAPTRWPPRRVWRKPLCEHGEHGALPNHYRVIADDAPDYPYRLEGR